MSAAHLLHGLDIEHPEVEALVDLFIERGVISDDVRSIGTSVVVLDSAGGFKSHAFADPLVAAGVALLVRALLVRERARRHSRRIAA